MDSRNIGPPQQSLFQLEKSLKREYAPGTRYYMYVHLQFLKPIIQVK